MQIVWILCPFVSHLPNTIDNLMNRCNSGCFLCLSRSVRLVDLCRITITVWYCARTDKTEEVGEREIAHWLNWWKIEANGNASLVELERLITGKALVNPNTIPKQMFISTEKEKKNALYSFAHANSDKIGSGERSNKNEGRRERKKRAGKLRKLCAQSNERNIVCVCVRFRIFGIGKSLQFRSANAHTYHHERT